MGLLTFGPLRWFEGVPDRKTQQQGQKRENTRKKGEEKKGRAKLGDRVIKKIKGEALLLRSRTELAQNEEQIALSKTEICGSKTCNFLELGIPARSESILRLAVKYS